MRMPSDRPRDPRHAAAAWLVALALPTVAPAASPLPVRSEREACGDLDGACAAWLAAADPADPRAEIALRRVGELRAWLARPTALLGDLARLSTGRTERLALGLRRWILLRAGRIDEALALPWRKGHVRAWWILGPLGSRHAAGLEPSFGVEHDAREDLVLRDGPRERRWRRMEIPPSARSLALRGRLRPASGMAYALAGVRLAGEVRIAVRCAGSFRIRVDGVPAGIVDRARAFRASEVRWAVRARPGPHRILLFLPASATFSVWIERPDGSLLDLPRSPGGFPPRGAGLLDGPRAIPDGGDAARAVAGDGIEERAAAAILFRAIGRADRAVEAAERAAAAAPDDPAIACLAAETIRGAGYLGRSTARNRARALLERALGARPDHVPAAVARAEEFAADGEPEKAYRLLERVLEAHPEAYRARIAIAGVAADRGWDREASAHAEEVDRVAPHPRTTAFRAARARKWLDPRGAAQILRSRLTWERPEAIREAARALVEVGRLEEADRLLARGLGIYPESAGLLAERARVAERRDDPGGAREALAARIALSPGDPARWRDLAGLLARAGRDAEARDALEHALALAPGDRATRRSLELALGEAPADDAAPYEEDVLEAFRTSGGADRYPGCEAVYLLDLAVLRILPDGSSRQTTHQACRILGEAGVEDHAAVSTPGEILRLRTIAADGEILEPTPAGGRTSWSMPGVRPGAAVEARWRAYREAPDPFQLVEPGFYLQDFRSKDAFRLSRYVVIFPEGFPLRYASRAGAGDPEVRRSGGEIAWIWERRDVPRLEPEPNAPADEDLYPNVVVAEARGLSEVGRALLRSVEGRDRPSPELRREAERITAGIDEPLERARAIYRYVCDKIQVEEGPPGATAVLLERAGDRRVLLKALLDAAGLEARWVWARPRPPIAPEPRWTIPRRSDWTHLLVEVRPPDRAPIFLAPRPRLMPFGRLPESLSGGYVLRPASGGARLGRLPEVPIDAFGERLRVRAGIAEGGSARIRVELEQSSTSAYRLLERLRTAPEELRRAAFAQVANGLFPGARVRSGAFPGLGEPDAPFRLALDLDVDRALQPGSPHPLLRPIPSPARLAARYGTRAHRELPLLLRAPLVSRFEGIFELGPYRPARIPRDRLLVSQAGSYALRFHLEGGALRVTRRLAVLPCRIEPDTFDAFLGFCRRVDAAEGERIPLAPARATAPAPGS